MQVAPPLILQVLLVKLSVAKLTAECRPATQPSQSEEGTPESKKEATV